jgi:hypothetical protein
VRHADSPQTELQRLLPTFAPSHSSIGLPAIQMRLDSEGLLEAAQNQKALNVARRRLRSYSSRRCSSAPDGNWLRPHNAKNTAQHRATLDQIALSDPAEWKDWLDWMLHLPLWLDLGSCRVVHAAWDDAAARACGSKHTIARTTLAKAGKRQSLEGSAVDWLLKGPEYQLGDGTLLVDKEGFARTSVRAKMVDSHSARHDSRGSRNAGG